MRKLIIVILVCAAILTGCGTNPAAEATEPAGQMQIGNPWKSYDTLTDAQTASGLVFPLPEEIDGYKAEVYRVMNGSLLEVQFRSGESEMIVRMKYGEDEDISGVYEDFTTIETSKQNGAAVTRKQADDCLVYLISLDGYSFSIYTSDPADDDICKDILSHIC